MDAGRAWARPAPVRQTEEVTADAAFWGLTMEPAPLAAETAIWEWHAPAWHAFLAVSRQWRTASVGMGGIVWIGLDYSATEAGLRQAGITIDTTIWAGLQLIEAGAIEELNRRG